MFYIVSLGAMIFNSLLVLAVWCGMVRVNLSKTNSFLPAHRLGVIWAIQETPDNKKPFPSQQYRGEWTISATRVRSCLSIRACGRLSSCGAVIHPTAVILMKKTFCVAIYIGSLVTRPV